MDFEFPKCRKEFAVGANLPRGVADWWRTTISLEGDNDPNNRSSFGWPHLLSIYNFVHLHFEPSFLEN